MKTLLAVVFFLATVPSVVTSAIAQTEPPQWGGPGPQNVPQSQQHSQGQLIGQNLDKKPPVIFAAEQSPAGEIAIRAVVVGECTGRLVLQTSLKNAEVFDVSDLRFGQTKVFPIGVYGQAGDWWSVSFMERESLPSTNCQQPPNLRIDTLLFRIGSDGWIQPQDRYPGPDGRKTFDESRSEGTLLRFGFRFPDVGPGAANYQIYVYQVFPNGTTSLEMITSAGTTPGTYSARVSRMTRNLPIRYIVSGGGASNFGVIYTP